MAPIDLKELDFATDILKGRLSDRMPLGVNIIAPNVAWLPANLSEHPGRFVGFFFKRDDGEPSFAWLSRNFAGMPGFTHVSVYYVNCTHTRVPEAEQKLFKAKKLPPHVKFCNVNLRSNQPKFLDLSVLIDGLEVTLTAGKLSLKPNGVYGMYGQDLMGCRAVREESCYWDPEIESTELWRTFSDMELKWKTLAYSDKTTPLDRDFDIIQLLLDEGLSNPAMGAHFVYCIHYKSARSLMILLTHSYLLWDDEDLEDIKKAITDRLRGYRFDYVGAIRYYEDGHNDANCWTPNICRAILLTFIYPITRIKTCDLQMIDEDYFEKMTIATDFSLLPSLPPDSSQVLDPSFSPDQHSAIHFSPFGQGEILDSHEADMSLVDETVSTQATIVMPTLEIESELASLRERHELRDNLESLDVPPLVDMPAYNDHKGDYLHSEKLFLTYIEAIVRLANAYAP